MERGEWSWGREVYSPGGWSDVKLDVKMTIDAADSGGLAQLAQLDLMSLQNGQ